MPLEDIRKVSEIQGFSVGMSLSFSLDRPHHRPVVMTELQFVVEEVGQKNDSFGDGWIHLDQVRIIGISVAFHQHRA